MGIRTIFRQPSCKPLSTCDPSLFQNKNKLESVHGGQNPVRPYLWVETSRLPPIYTALVVDKHWNFIFTRLPNLLYSKRQLYQRMKLGKTVTFYYAVKLPSFRRLAIEYTGCLLDVYCYTNVFAQVFPKVLGCVLCGLGEIVAQTYAVDLAVCFLQV
jgi:hypothetical protein